MKEYFNIQFLMANRKLKEAGINPLFGYVLGLLALILVSEYIYQKTEFAKYLLLLTCGSLQFKLSEKGRSDFLLTTFGNKRKRNIRIIENTMISIPFLAILIFHNAFFESLILFIISLISATLSFHSNFDVSIPTPFSKRPFEFTVGFRKTFYIYLIAYALTIVALSIDNLNLGIFSMMLIFLTALTFYLTPENEYYVWVHANTPSSFLIHKIKDATKNVLLLTTPILLSLVMFSPGEFGLILLFFAIGLLFVWTIILAKYSVYPNEINLPEVVILGFSIFFPPILLVILPFFYIKSIKKLKLILNDKN